MSSGVDGSGEMRIDYDNDLCAELPYSKSELKCVERNDGTYEVVWQHRRRCHSHNLVSAYVPKHLHIETR